MKKPLKLKKEKVCAERDEIDVAYEKLLLHKACLTIYEVGDRILSVRGILECYDHVEEPNGFSPTTIWKWVRDGIS